jgi:putative transposase
MSKAPLKRASKKGEWILFYKPVLLKKVLEKKRGHRTFALAWRPSSRHNAPMPRTARASQGGFCYHVLNRGNARRTVFHKAGDFVAFLKLLRQAGERTPMRLLAYCLMPNHFHLVLWPFADGDLSTYMGWLLTAHVRRYHQHYHSSGHVWQGRFRAFPIQEDEHLLTVLRYSERNPLRANFVQRAQQWPWSSAGPPHPEAPALDPGPVPRPDGWLDLVNEPQTEAEVERLRESLRRGRPFGDSVWMRHTAVRLGLEASLRPRGRPKKGGTQTPSFFELPDPK